MTLRASLRAVTGQDAFRPVLVVSNEAAGRGSVRGQPRAGRPARPPSPPSFDALYRSHYARVFGLCRHLLRQHTQAEDATQEVFMRAYRRFGDYDPAKRFAPWVLKIAANYCVDVVRRRAKETELFGSEAAEAAAIESDEPGVVAGLISAERETTVREAIDRLPDKYRIPLVLAYYDEARYDDIAATLGLTRNHVGVLILRGKQALRREIAAAGRGDAL